MPILRRWLVPFERVSNKKEAGALCAPASLILLLQLLAVH